MAENERKVEDNLHYTDWLNEYKRLESEIRFGSSGKTPEEILEPLKQRISADVNKSLHKYSVWRKIRLWGILIGIALLVICMATSEDEGFLMFGVAVTAGSIFIPRLPMSECDDTCAAYSAFDDQYFHGEIQYRRKNGKM